MARTLARRVRIPPAFWQAQRREMLALADALRPQLVRAWRAMGEHVVDRLARFATQGKALKADLITPGDLIPPEDEALIARLLRRHWQVAIGAGAATAQDVLALLTTFDLPMVEVQRVIDELANRIVGINDTTRQHVRRVVVDALLDGASIADIQERLRGLFVETYRNRAENVARTESATAYNRGALLAYRESGLVEQVLVYDGDGCGWLRHDDPDKAHGSRRSIADAEAHPLAHPRCRRAFAPVLDER